MSSVLAGTISHPSLSTLDVPRRGGLEEHSMKILDTRSVIASKEGGHLLRLGVRDDDDDNDDEDDNDDDGSLFDNIRDKASGVEDDIKGGASGIKKDVENKVDDVFDDNVGSLRPGIILPALFAAIVMAVGGM